MRYTTADLFRLLTGVAVWLGTTKFLVAWQPEPEKLLALGAVLFAIRGLTITKEKP